MPVRKILKNYRNVTGIAANSKAVGQAIFESTLERDFITLLEFDPHISSFEVQPLTIRWIEANYKKTGGNCDLNLKLLSTMQKHKV